PAHAGSPAKARYDVVYVVDGRGWYYRYSHLKTIDVKAGDRVQRGQRLGTLGKEGTSGGWSHLHFDITSRQPSGDWGIQDAYAYVWEAYQREYQPKIIAVARPHHLAAVNETVNLNGEKSWSKIGPIRSYEWTLSDGTTATTATVSRQYPKPGAYSEILKVTDSQGNVAWDFASVQVAAPNDPTGIPASLHLSFYPSREVKPGDEITFKVRSFRTKPSGEIIDFGDGTPPVSLRSDGGASRNAPDGYAITTHRFQRPGNYLVTATHLSAHGHPATARVWVEVKTP
ncbi:MAG TPA: PKD domain-containing protein, partial [Opitutaceae bacterium]|nr:PKD domain-containing protein [Opitutaceae bacterium]